MELLIFKVDFLNKSKIISQHFAIFFKLKLLKKYFGKKKISLKILKFDILFFNFGMRQNVSFGIFYHSFDRTFKNFIRIGKILL